MNLHLLACIKKSYHLHIFPVLWPAHYSTVTLILSSELSGHPMAACLHLNNSFKALIFMVAQHTCIAKEWSRVENFPRTVLSFLLRFAAKL